MKNFLQSSSISCAIKFLKKEEVIAYPTESVFGIGCDPDSETAVNRLLRLKKRHVKKGLILVASHFEQLKPYVNDSILTPSQWKTVFSVWPGNVTFVFPAKLATPYWLTGDFKSIAVRVTNHPVVVKLCHLFGKPIVSSSINLSGLPPCRTAWEVRKQFGNIFPIIEGETHGYLNPSEIRDVITGKCYRKG